MVGDIRNLNRLVYFTTVVDAGSFTAAAARLGVEKAAVSHQVARLEAELGVTLLSRTTRRLSITEEGQVFYDRCASILREADAAYDEMSSHTQTPTGTLTLTAPLDYGTAVVAGVVTEYLRLYPAMKVDLIFDDSVIDPASQSLDLAIRVGWLTDSSHQARRIGTFQQYVAATSALLAQMPPVRHPADLATFPWIENSILRHPLRWTFQQGDQSVVEVEMRTAIRADKTPAAYACVLAGGGISIFPDYMIDDSFSEGRLVRLLPDWTLPQGGIHAVFPVARYRPAKSRRFVELLIAAERKRAGG